MTWAATVAAAAVLAAPPCPRDAGSSEAAALFRRARPALERLAVVPDAHVRRLLLRYERQFGRDGEEVVLQHVSRDATPAREPPQALPGDWHAGRRGFTPAHPSDPPTLIPDAALLTDERFLSAYCKSSSAANDRRPGEHGVRFLPREREAGRVDVDATLWLDSATATPTAIEFRYLGVHPSVEAYRPGGRVTFRKPANGPVFVAGWSVRTVSGGIVREMGVEVGYASWPDGREWSAPLGSARVRAVDIRGRTRVGIPIQLPAAADTASSDRSGWVEFRGLLPGPYEAIVVDPELDALGLPPVGRVAFTVGPDSVTSVQLLVHTAEEFVEKACQDAGLYSAGSYLLIGRIVTARGRPALGAAWEITDLRRRSTRIMPRGMADPSTARGVVGSDGIFVYCRALDWGSVVEMKVWRNRSLLRGEPATVALRSLNKRVTGVRIELPD